MSWRLLSATIVLGAALAAGEARAITFEDSIGNGSSDAPSVPEPGAALLFGVGLVLVGRVRRQLRRT
jgi:hypothetical protein